MVEIKDLSTLLALLENNPQNQIEARFDPEVFESLKVCLKLGVRNAAQWQPAAFSPKSLTKLFDPLQGINDIVRVKDFQQLIDATRSKDTTPLNVDKTLLDEGMAWVEEAVSGNAHFEQQIQALVTRIKSTSESLVEAPKNFLQDLVDWLDRIQRNRPNEVAEELRKSVRQHNTQILEPKTKGRYDN